MSINYMSTISNYNKYIDALSSCDCQISSLNFFHIDIYMGPENIFFIYQHIFMEGGWRGVQEEQCPLHIYDSIF